MALRQLIDTDWIPPPPTAAAAEDGIWAIHSPDYLRCLQKYIDDLTAHYQTGMLYLRQYGFYLQLLDPYTVETMLSLTSSCQGMINKMLRYQSDTIRELEERENEAAAHALDILSRQ